MKGIRVKNLTIMHGAGHIQRIPRRLWKDIKNKKELEILQLELAKEFRVPFHKISATYEEVRIITIWNYVRKKNNNSGSHKH